MVEVFLVHPNLNITDCSARVDLDQYQRRYVRAIDDYELLIDKIVSSRPEVLKDVSPMPVIELQNEKLLGKNEVDIRIPAIPDYDIELSQLVPPLSSLENKMLDFYRTHLELQLQELNYFRACAVMNSTMKEIFSKLELSFEEEEEGIKLINKHTEAIKLIEAKIVSLKNHSVQLEDLLKTEYGFSQSYTPTHHHSRSNSSRSAKNFSNLMCISEEDSVA